MDKVKDIHEQELLARDELVKRYSERLVELELEHSDDKEELLKEGSLYNRASGLVKTKDLYAFVKMGKSMKFELEKDGFGDRQVQEFLQELIKKRIL